MSEDRRQDVADTGMRVARGALSAAFGWENGVPPVKDMDQLVDAAMVLSRWLPRDVAAEILRDAAREVEARIADGATS